MSIRFSPIISARTRSAGGAFSLKAVDLRDLGDHASPVTVLDDFRVRGQPFSPHPHAGFSAVTYVFETQRESSAAATRSATTSSSGPAESSGRRPEAA